MANQTPKELTDYITQLSNLKLIEQKFSEIREDLTEGNYKTALLRENCHKNAFPNVLAVESSRVKLNDVYVNANHILDKYIATQGPIPTAYSDFWQLISEKKVGLIVNLTDNNDYISEVNRITTRYTIKMQMINSTNFYQHRKLVIVNNTNETIHTVTHLTFLSWPDFGISDENEFMKFYDVYSQISNVDQIAIHCRAGIGRTGTFILIDYILRKAKYNQYCDPFELLKQMRMSRAGMIQGLKQFVFALEIVKKRLIIDFLKIPKIETDLKY
jgi:protein tyrosine phosphatase